MIKTYTTTLSNSTEIVYDCFEDGSKRLCEKLNIGYMNCEKCPYGYVESGDCPCFNTYKEMRQELERMVATAQAMLEQLKREEV